jgi:hypothetical protein
VPQAKLDEAKEGWRKDSMKEHHEEMLISGHSWLNHIRQMMVPMNSSEPHFKAASKKPHFFTKDERTWTEVVAIVEAFECVLDHTHLYPKTYNDSNMFCPPTQSAC